MMHYRKAENIEKQLTKDELPFDDFLAKGSDFLWMHVNGGTKVTNVVSYAKNALDKGECKHVVWSGKGGGVVKTISCAEILKRSYPLYQVTRMCYTSVEEHWKPQMEGLEEIVANRQIPSLHIFMSLEPIEDSVSGLQKPNTKTDFWIYDTNSAGNQNNTASGTSNNNNRNQRQRNGGNSGQRRPQKSRPPQNVSNNDEQQSPAPNAGNESNSGKDQQNKSTNASKRRRPHPNQNRGPKPPTNNGNDNNTSQPMES